MRIAVIINGQSFKKKQFYKKVLPLLSERWHVEAYETKAPQEEFQIAKNRILPQKFDLLLVGGGDGTLNHTINGLLSQPKNLPPVGILPMGTGNDFARALDIRFNPIKLVNAIEKFNLLNVDVGKVTFQESMTEKGDQFEKYFLNELDVGMGPEVVQRVLNSKSLLPSGLAYYLSILATFLNFKGIDIEAKSNQWSWKGSAKSIAIINGKYYGHGLCIAPESIPDDQKMTAFIAGKVSMFDFIRLTGKLKGGKKVNHPFVEYKEIEERIVLDSNSKTVFELDGELTGWLPASISIVPKAIKLLTH